MKRRFIFSMILLFAVAFLSQVMAEIVVENTFGKSGYWGITHDDATGYYTLVIGGQDIPDYSEGKAPWYSWHSVVQRLKLYERVTVIGRNAFYGFEYLELINDGQPLESVTKIKPYAFEKCARLRIAEFPKVTEIGSGAFRSCGNLLLASFPKAEKVGNEAFFYTGSWKGEMSIDLSSVKKIGTEGISNVNLFHQREQGYPAPAPSLYFPSTPPDLEEGSNGMYFPVFYITPPSHQHDIVVIVPYGSLKNYAGYYNKENKNWNMEIGDYFVGAVRQGSSHRAVGNILQGGPLYTNGNVRNGYYYYGTQYDPAQSSNYTSREMTICFYGQLKLYTHSKNGLGFDYWRSSIDDFAPNYVNFKNVTSIGKLDFFSKPKNTMRKSIKAIYLPSTLTKIDEKAFKGQISLKGIYSATGEAVNVEIGDYVFDECTNLATIDSKINITQYGKYSFSETGFKEVYISDNITELPAGVFYRCPNLTQIHLGKNIKTIQENAFGYLTVPQYDAIHVFVNSSAPETPGGWGPFRPIITPDMTGQYSKAKLHVSSEYAQSYRSKYPWNRFTFVEDIHFPISGDGWEITSYGTLIISKMPTYSQASQLKWYPYYSYINDLQIKEGVTEIPDNYFNFVNCFKEFRSINLPTSLKRIGKNAFQNQQQLENLVIQGNDLVIDESAFAGARASNGMSMTGVKSIGSMAFYGEFSKLLIAIETPPIVAEDAFRKNDSGIISTQIAIFGTDDIFMRYFTADVWRDFDYSLYNLDLSEHGLLVAKGEYGSSGDWYLWSNGLLQLNAGQAVNVYLPSALTDDQKKMVRHIEIFNVDPEGILSSISASAYPNIETIQIPEDIKKINGLQSLTKLKTINLENVEKIAGSTFNNCTSLEEVDLSSLTSTIEANTFEGCSSLKTITMPQNEVVVLNAAFKNCTSLETIDLSNAKFMTADPNASTTPDPTGAPGSAYNISENIFEGCTSLKSVSVDAKTIPAGTFNGCTALEEVTLGDNTRLLQYDALGNTALKTLICKSLVPPDCYSYGNAFGETEINGVDLYVHKDVMDVYKSTRPYSVMTIHAIEDKIPEEAEVESIWPQYLFPSGSESWDVPPSVYIVCYEDGKIEVHGPDEATIVEEMLIALTNIEAYYDQLNKILTLYFDNDITELKVYVGDDEVISESTASFFRYLNEPWSIPLAAPEHKAKSAYNKKAAAGTVVLSLGENLKTIGDYFFWNYIWGSDVEINLYAMEPPTMGDNTFNWLSIEGATLHVRNDASVVSKYQKHSLWSKFNIVGDLPAPEKTPEYTVTFVANGKTISTQTIKEGHTAEEPTAPEVTGKNFIGWDKEFSYVKSNLTVTAQYEDIMYSVIFFDWDGEILSSQDVKHGASAVAPAEPTRANWKFTGWSEDFTNVTEPLSIEALYEQQVATVTFLDKDGNTIDSRIVTIGSSITDLPKAPVVEGYTFIGWENELWLSDVQFDFSTIALYEKTVLQEFTVVFLDHDGTELSKQTVTEGESAVAPANPTWEGHNFTGWDKDFSNVQSDLTITAVYDVTLYTVTFVDWNGTVLAVDKVEPGKDATAPANPTRPGYAFTGWDIDFTNVQSNLTVTAQYEQQAAGEVSINITIEGNGHIIAVDKDNNEVALNGKFAKGTELTLTAVADEGNEFVSWSIGATQLSTLNTIKVILNADMSLTATFHEVTGIEDINAEQLLKPLKVMDENGRVYILMPDGRRFNVAGQQLK